MNYDEQGAAPHFQILVFEGQGAGSLNEFGKEEGSFMYCTYIGHYDFKKEKRDSHTRIESKLMPELESWLAFPILRELQA